MKVVVIGSGSKGNAVYIETQEAKILIDNGLSYLEMVNRLASQGIYLKTLDAIFITHEHIDHTAGLVRTMKMTQAKLFINMNSFYQLRKVILNSIDFENVYFIEEKRKYLIKDLSIVPITLSHDSINCYGYLLKAADSTYAHITDTGFLKKEYFKLLKYFDTILLESNHDIELLQNSNRPYYLKQRILSRKGHLSNNDCCKYLKEIVTDKTKRVILAHLSEECNNEDLAKQLVEETFNNELAFELLIAKQRVALPIITIGDENV